MKRVGMWVMLILWVMLGSVCQATTDITLHARHAILWDCTSKRVLYEKAAYEEVPNASTTKILTAIVIVETCPLEEVVEIGPNAVKVTGSKVKFREGDTITVGDLLKGMLLCSGNDAAVALAEYRSGSVEAFCEEMNEKAQEIGAMHTHFVSPHGLDAEEHYSTAYDLALLADYALQIPELACIFDKTTETITISGVPRTIFTTNEMLYQYPNSNGVKTGYTGKAGRCLVTSAKNDDGWQLISVVLGCDTKNFRTQDSTKLLNYGFQNYHFVNIGNILPERVVFEVDKSQEKQYKVEVNYDYWYPMTTEEEELLHYEVGELPELLAPLPQNTEILQYTVWLRGPKDYQFFIKIVRTD